MFQHQKFHYQDTQALRQDITQMELNIPFADSIDVLKQPLVIGSKTVPNRLIIHPMEGCDGQEDGRPSELIYRRYDRFARGGAGLLWFEATAVVPEGRANPRQLLLTRETAPAFKELLEKTLLAAREEYGEAYKPYTVIQLTHSGRYSKPGLVPEPIIALNIPELDNRLPPQYKIISDEELELLEDKYVEAAELASEVGFDAVDIKACHRYLINELLGAHARAGRYGGSFENRIRFICNIVDKVRNRVGSKIDIAVRMNAYDALTFPYGWGVDREDWHKPDFSEPAKLAQILYDKGVKLINVTAGNPYYNPHVNRPFDLGYYTPPYHPLENVAIILQAAQAIQTAANKAGGYSNLSGKINELRLRMTTTGGHIRVLSEIEKALMECRAELMKFPDDIVIKNESELPSAFRYYDMLLTQLAYLATMAEYSRQGGQSRGSYLIYDQRGQLPVPGLPEEFRYSLDDGRFYNQVCETALQLDEDWQCHFTWVPVRPIPQQDNWFEKVWTEFRQGKVYEVR